MKKIYLSLLKTTIALCMILSAIGANGKEYPKIVVNGGIEVIELEVGETIVLKAAYYTSEEQTEEVDIKWIINPSHIGSLSEGVFTALRPGEGSLHAVYGTTRKVVKLLIGGEGEEEEEEEEDEEEEETDEPKVVAVPGNVRIEAGRYVELTAFYIGENGREKNVTFTWAVEPAELGEFPDPEKSEFHAKMAGEGIITATYGDLSDTIKLKVLEPKTKPEQANSGKKITITPGNLEVDINHEPIQYHAEYSVNGKKHETAELLWSMSGDPVGEIDENGLVTLNGTPGLALIIAKVSNFRSSVELVVIDPDADNEKNSIAVHRVLPSGQVLPAKKFMEGDSYRLGGLPFPLNVLNGGLIHFPMGCITENIIIHMQIPEEYAELDEENDEVSFTDGNFAGVEFHVKPEGSDEFVEPYEFEIPLNLSIPFKRGLLDELGVSPENLDVFFAENTGFVSEGTGNITVDIEKNLIYAKIEHFSTLVVRLKNMETIAEEFARVSDSPMLVYPNPFSQSATIIYNVPEQAKINLHIFNLQGKMIKSLVSEVMQMGTYTAIWDGTVHSGMKAAPGVYLCVMFLNDNRIDSRQLIYNK